ESRDLGALKADLEAVSQSQIQGVIRHELQRDDVKRWDFGDLPESTQSEINGLPVRAYPCLKEVKGELEITVEADQQTARESHRAGLLSLFRKSLSEQERVFKTSINKVMGARWLQAKGMGTQQSLTEDLLKAAFQLVFVPLDEPLPYKESEFAERTERRAEFIEQAEQLLDQFAQWVTLRHKILKAMRGAVSLDRAMAYSDVQAQLERLLAPGFMLEASWPHLKCFVRYLKAMDYRIDKLQGNLPRDRLGMTEFASLWEPFQKQTQGMDLTDPENPFTEFRWLLEEWRVSLFAQPLGTKEAVSLKRLEKRWAELVS
ncbi:MAG: DUF3418 domain-containing protein, partial [Oceanobacter sp.]